MSHADELYTELARTAATLGLGMHEITTYRDLRSALADILRSAD